MSVISFLGRFSVAVLCTLVGAGGGLFLGLWRGFVAMNATPPAPATMGFESAGAASIIVLAVYLGLGAVGGAVVGLLAGVVVAVFWRRTPEN